MVDVFLLVEPDENHFEALKELAEATSEPVTFTVICMWGQIRLQRTGNK